jgi:electron transfer flavoprotein alpha subunit
MAEPGSILVVAEHNAGSLRSISTELLGAARRLAAELNQAVTSISFGSSADAAATEAVTFGADEALYNTSASFDEYHNEVWTAALNAVSAELAPSVVLFGQTETGRDLAPRFATRAGTAVAMDCIDLAVRDRKLLMTRPCYGGSAHAVYTSKTTPQVATLRAKSQEPLEADASRGGSTREVDVGSTDATSIIAGHEVVESEGMRLEDAKVIISGGRGLGSGEAFHELATLAEILNGAVAASRAAVDLGWAPISSQVGLTGKVVTPDLYVAIAISGASQHIAGITGARTVVAVNRDENADIFTHSRYGVVADWKAFLPAFTEECRKLAAST